MSTATYRIEQAAPKQEELARYMAIISMVAMDHPHYAEDLLSIRDHIESEWQYVTDRAFVDTALGEVE